jgi:hypothetical protein
MSDRVSNTQAANKKVIGGQIPTPLVGKESGLASSQFKTTALHS